MEEVSLIIAAMDCEVEALLNVVEYKEVIIGEEKLYSFTKNGENYLLGQGKIGKVSTAFYLGKLFQLLKVKRVFNIGTCGGVSDKLKLNSVFIGEKVIYSDVDVTGFGYELGQMPSCPKYFECDLDYVNARIIDSKYDIVKGIIGSGDQFVTKLNYNATNLPKLENIVCCDMESGAVGQCCTMAHIPFVIVRSISDIVTVEVSRKGHEENKVESSTNSALVLLELLK